MTKSELEIFKNKLVEQGYKYSNNLRIPYFWKNIVSRPDSDGDMRAVVMITYDIYDYSKYEYDEQYQYSYMPAITISRDYDDFKLDTPKLSIKELEEFAVKFFDFVEQNIPAPK